MYKIVGIESVNYVSKKTGRSVVGSKLYLITDDVKQNLVGHSTTEIFVSSQIQGIPVLSVNDNVQIFFNQFGSVQAVEKIPPKAATT